MNMPTKYLELAGVWPISRPAWRWWLALAVRAFGAWCAFRALRCVPALTVFLLSTQLRGASALQLGLDLATAAEVLLAAASGLLFLFTPRWGFPGFYIVTLISVVSPQPFLPLQPLLLAETSRHPSGVIAHTLAVDAVAVVVFAVIQNLLPGQPTALEREMGRRWPLKWLDCGSQKVQRRAIIALRLLGIWMLAAAIIGLWHGGVPRTVPTNLPPGSDALMREAEFARCVFAAFSGALFITLPRWGFPTFYAAAILSVPLGVFALPLSQLGAIHARFVMTAIVASTGVNAGVVLIMGLVQCLLLRPGGTVEAESRHPAGTNPAIGGGDSL